MISATIPHSRSVSQKAYVFIYAILFMITLVISHLMSIQNIVNNDTLVHFFSPWFLFHLPKDLLSNTAEIEYYILTIKIQSGIDDSFVRKLT